MSLQQSASARPDALPDDLRSPRAKLVYLYLKTSRGATVQELQDALNLKKITLYSLLQTLTERDLVQADADAYVVRDVSA